MVSQSTRYQICTCCYTCRAVSYSTCQGDRHSLFCCDDYFKKINAIMENTPLQKISFLVLRIMGSLIFILAGFNHILQTAGAAARLEKAPFAGLATWIAPAETLIILSGVGLLIGGSMLLAGFKTRLAAALLLAILIPITLTVQVGAEGSGPLFKNIALIGMLLFFIVNGAVYYG